MADFIPTFEQEESYLQLLKNGLVKASEPGSVCTVEELKHRIDEQENKVATMRDAILEDIAKRFSR